MKMIATTSAYREANSVLILLAVAFSATVAMGQPPAFVEDFLGPDLDPAWTVNDGDNPGGHLGITDGTYKMTDAHGSPGAKIQRFFPENTLTTYTNEIEVILDPFLLSGSGGTKTDLKWKSFGPDGFMEVVLNSFGDMRLWHSNNTAGVNGNLQGNIKIGLSDGDLLKLAMDYHQGTDTIDVNYSLNGGPATDFYSGPGNGGSIGNVITNFVEVEVFKWGEDPSDQATAAIDSWSLTPIPEPTAAALLGLGSLLLIAGIRKR